MCLCVAQAGFSFWLGLPLAGNYKSNPKDSFTFGSKFLLAGFSFWLGLPSGWKFLFARHSLWLDLPASLKLPIEKMINKKHSNPQAHWQWIFSSQNKIEKKDKPVLLQMMRKLVYSETQEDFNKELEEMSSNPTFLKYPNYSKHLNDNILPRKDEWSLMFRIQSQLPTNNVNCSNYCEVSFRITKDLKFNRNRAFNQLELLQIECDESSYYSQRCIDVASNTLTSRLVNQNSRFLNRRTIAIDPDKIRREADGTFTVPSETKEDVEYSVDMDLRICSCPNGILKGPCKHRKVVATSQNVLSFDIIPESSPEMRSIWMELGTGRKTPSDYFLPLSNPSEAPGETNVERDDLMEIGELDETNVENVQREDLMEIEEDPTERIEKAKSKLNSLLQSINEMYSDRIPHDVVGYEKALKTLENHLNRFPTTNDAALQKALHNFGETQTESLRGGRRKKGSKIPVQVTSRARRQYKMRGSRVAPGEFKMDPSRAFVILTYYCIQVELRGRSPGFLNRWRSLRIQRSSSTLYLVGRKGNQEMLMT